MRRKMLGWGSRGTGGGVGQHHSGRSEGGALSVGLVVSWRVQRQSGTKACPPAPLYVDSACVADPRREGVGCRCTIVSCCSSLVREAWKTWRRQANMRRRQQRMGKAREGRHVVTQDGVSHRTNRGRTRVTSVVRRHVSSTLRHAVEVTRLSRRDGSNKTSHTCRARCTLRQDEGVCAIDHGGSHKRKKENTRGGGSD